MMDRRIDVAPLAEDDPVLERGVRDQIRVGLEFAGVRYHFLEEIFRLGGVAEGLQTDGLQEGHEAQVVQVIFTTCAEKLF